MPKKATKSKAKSKQKGNQISVPIGVIITLSVALIIAIIIAVCAIVHIKSFDNSLSNAKLETFDHVIDEYVGAQEIVSDKSSVNEATGYGVSDEDGVFYVTFDFAPYTLDENGTPQYDGLRHGILYFWKDAKNNTYSHAFSYHDDYYHPGGVYTEIGKHYLRSQLEQAQ